MNKRFSRLLRGMVCLAAFSFLGCGVKGDPQPPLKPAPLGRGQPTFKDAVKGIKPEKIEKKDKNGK